MTGDHPDVADVRQGSGMNNAEMSVRIKSDKAPGDQSKIQAVYDDRRFISVQGVSRRYAPSRHHRLFALVDSRFAIIMDKLDAVASDREADLYFQLDTNTAEWLDDNRKLVTDDEVNLLLCTGSNLRGRMLEGFVDDGAGGIREATRVRFTDVTKGDRSYVTIMVPFREGEKLPEVSDVKIKSSGSSVRASFVLDGSVYRIVWNDRLIIEC